MASTSYFANDLTGIGQAILQDQGQRLAADAARRQFMSDLNRTAAERYRAQQDAAARMYQTQAYRDVGMNDAAIRREIGLGEIDVRRGDTASREKIGLMPYDRMTPAQAAEIEVKKDYLKLQRDNPYMLGGDPRIRQEMFRDQKDKEELRMIAATANSNLKRRGGVDALKAEIAKQMDQYGGFMGMFKRDSGGGGLVGKDPETAADAIATGGPMGGSYATGDAVKAARKYFEQSVYDAIPGDPTTRAQIIPYLRFDNESGMWHSMYDPPPSMNRPTGDVTGAITTSPTIGTNTPLITIQPAPPTPGPMISTQGMTSLPSLNTNRAPLRTYSHNSLIPTGY